MGQCVCVCVCVYRCIYEMYATKSVQCVRKLIFVLVVLGGEVRKCQNGICDVDLDLESEGKVQRSRNVD